MFDHVGLKVRDYQKSKTFYAAALAPLGLEAVSVDDPGKSAGFGRGGATPLWISEGPVAPIHLAFASPDRKTVDAFYHAALKAGGRDNGKPGLRESYSPTYYAAFVLDPDGNNVELVCQKA